MEDQYPQCVIHHPRWLDVEINLELETDIQADIADFENWMNAEVLEDYEIEPDGLNTTPYFQYDCADTHNCNSFRRNNYACRCIRRNFKTAKHFAQYNRGVVRNVMQGITGE